jgi:hypothetical protein
MPLGGLSRYANGVSFGFGYRKRSSTRVFLHSGTAEIPPHVCVVLSFLPPLLHTSKSTDSHSPCLHSKMDKLIEKWDWDQLTSISKFRWEVGVTPFSDLWVVVGSAVAYLALIFSLQV